MDQQQLDVQRRLSVIEDDLRSTSDSLNELTTIVMGPLPNRSNGIRGNLREIEDKLDKAVAWANDLWYNKRKEDCLGMEACERLRKDVERLLKEDEEMSKSRLGFKGVVLAASIPSVLSMVTTIAVALLSKR